jgi:lysophospholipase L1-like esterase
MYLHRFAVDRPSLIRGLAVLCVASMSAWGSGATTGVTAHPAKPASDPPSVVFIGDSITAIWGGGQEGPQFAEHPNWIDQGIGGQTSNQVLARFQADVVDLHPEMVHILIGTNDVYPGWTLVPSGANAIDSAANVEAMVEWNTRYSGHHSTLGLPGVQLRSSARSRSDIKPL